MFIIITSKTKLLLEQLKSSSWVIHHKKMDTSVMIQKNKKLYVSRDVTFQEDESYYQKEKMNVISKNLLRNST
jgi:hypothetical protein